MKKQAVKFAALATFSLLVLYAFAYVVYLQVLFPTLVPSYGSGEKFTLEPDNTVLIKMEANSPVSGIFTAWQETPLEGQLLALTLLSIGIAGVAISVISLKKK